MSALIELQNQEVEQVVPETPQEDLPGQADVRRWQQRIAASEKKFEPDFKRMKNNMKFVYGKQWPGQQELDCEKYVANSTLRMVNQKVASLYARNPTAEVTLRKRLDFQIWDEDVTSLMEMVQNSLPYIQAGVPLPPEMAAFFADVQNGRQRKKLVKRVAKTVEILYQYFVDAQKPDFIAQAKQMVRRTIVCGVGFVRVNFCVNNDANYKSVSTVDYPATTQAMAGRAQEIMRRMEETGEDENSPDVQTLRSLAVSLGASGSLEPTADEDLPVRLEFDFPPATSVIVDERCTNLEEFIACRWIAQKYILPVEDVNSIFGVDVKVGSGQAVDKASAANPYSQENPSSEPSLDSQEKKLVALYEVFDKRTKTRFFIVEGWKDYVLPPEPVMPKVSGFWNHFALIFNQTEYEEGCEGSIYPPSDVQQIKHPQLEWNRTRNALRDQRNANAPKYLTRKGMISETDIARLNNATPNSVVELDSVPMDQPLEKFIATLQMAPIDERLYDTGPLEQDMMLSGGMQQANIGPAQPNVTATVGTIAEESRLTVSASNVQDLDGVLGRLAQASGEMLIRGMPVEVAQRIAGVGAVMPQLEQSREDFLNEILLTIKASSSGRPNKAVEVANFRDLAPIMIQAGANPVGVIEEGARRLDDNLDVTKFFPIVPQGGAQTQLGAQGTEQPSNKVQPSGMRRPPQNVSEGMGNPQDNTVELPNRGVGPSRGSVPAAA